MSPAAPTPEPPGRERAPALAAATPALLLPVRIETRFVDSLDGASSLLVRVFPDTISISSFEPELTQDEISAGTAYWNLVWQAGNPPPSLDVVQAPWRVLAAAYQPERAAWIALALTPTNLAQQPTAPTPAGQSPSPAPIFPSPPTRASSYEQAPVTQALPDAWTVVLYSGANARQVVGAPISPNLKVGLTPHDGTLPDGLPVDAGMRWLVDFAEAVKGGMGVQIELSAAERASGFDRIIVLGLRAARADGPGNAALATLLNTHHYTDGFALVPQGAPTNNTPDASSAYSRKDPSYDISFQVERSAPLTGPPGTDGPVAAALLGIPTTTFDHVQYSDWHGVQNGRDMLTALWPATLGYFMNQMLSPVFTQTDLDAARSYALAQAIPRGRCRPFASATPLMASCRSRRSRFIPRLPRRSRPFRTPSSRSWACSESCFRSGRPARAERPTSVRPATPTRTSPRSWAWTPAPSIPERARSSATTRCGTSCGSRTSRAPTNGGPST